MSQFCDPLVELLALSFEANDHIVVHASGHWVIKRLINSEGQREGEEQREGEGEGEEGTSFAERILDKVSADDIRGWTTTNRGAFVTCRYIITTDYRLY